MELSWREENEAEGAATTREGGDVGLFIATSDDR